MWITLLQPLPYVMHWAFRRNPCISLAAASAGENGTIHGKQSGTLVIVDYAHNRMSFDRLFRSTIKSIRIVILLPYSAALGKKHWRGDRNWQRLREDIRRKSILRKRIPGRKM